MLLATLRKTLSLFTIANTKPISTRTVNSRCGMGHRLLAAKCQRHEYVIEILGFHLSHAFDTVTDVLHSAFTIYHWRRNSQPVLKPARSAPIQLDSRHSTRGLCCRRYSLSCISKQPFGRCSDAFQADRQPTTTYTQRGNIRRLRLN